MGLINDFDLPREAIPTQWLNELEVWGARLQRMPLTALVRNPGKMSAVGLVKPFSQSAELVVRKLKDEALLKRARIHPLTTPTIVTLSVQPVLKSQAGHFGEVARVAGQESGVVDKCDAGAL